MPSLGDWNLEVEIWQDGTVCITFPDGQHRIYDSGTILSETLCEELNDWSEKG